jgi:hypothetical protein
MLTPLYKRETASAELVPMSFMQETVLMRQVKVCLKFFSVLIFFPFVDIQLLHYLRSRCIVMAKTITWTDYIP